MKYQAIAASIYAFLLFIGGVIGYLTANSLSSLIMGTLFAVLMGICAWGMFKGCNASRISAIVLTVLMLAFFGYRLFASYKFFPAGMMVLCSLALLVGLQFWKKSVVSSLKT